MKKTDLVKLITKKAGVSDSSANEFFDIFLRKIAEEMELGESARFSSLGYFHYRRGEIKKQNDINDPDKNEYLDLIIFSPTSQLNIKSHDNVVFSVSETQGKPKDSIDYHFSLSVGKPVLPQLEGKESTVDSDQFSEGDYQKFENKASNLISNLHIDDNIKSEGEILLVDIRSIDSDQFELELNDEAVKKNSEKVSDPSIHSSEKLKTKAWDFGNILSKQIEEKTDSHKDMKFNLERTRSESAKWDFGKRYWGNVSASQNNSVNKLQPKVQEKPQEPKTEFNEADNSESSNESFNIADEETPDIKMDDFKIPVEEDKMDKFERVRSIRSSLKNEFDDKTDINSTDLLKRKNDKESDDTDEIFKRLKSKIDDLHSSKENEKADDDNDSSGEINTDAEIKLNPSEHKTKTRYEGRNTSSSVVKILIVLVIVIGGLYLLFKGNGNKKVTEVVSNSESKNNTTYIERNYDVPVTYPYDKNEKEQEITGINLVKEKDLSTEEKNIKQNPTETDKKETDKKEQPVVTKQNGPVLIESNIYFYGGYYVVQVSSFRSEQVAENIADKYKSQGHQAFVETVLINGNDWYRVRVGNFNTLVEAQKFKNSNN